MAQKSKITLTQDINNVIAANGVEAITGPVLNALLIDIVDSFVNLTEVLQGTGVDTEKAMSQDAVTTALNALDTRIADNESFAAGLSYLNNGGPGTNFLADDGTYKTVTAVADWATITGKPLTFTPDVHGHSIADVTGLQTALDGFTSPDWSSLSGGPTSSPALIDSAVNNSHSNNNDPTSDQKAALDAASGGANAPTGANPIATIADITGVPSLSSTDLTDITITGPTEGDIFVRTATGFVNIPIGTNTQILTSDGTTASWQDAPAGGGGGANLSATIIATQFTIESDSGNDVIIPSANVTEAGAYPSADFNKVAGIQSGAQVNPADLNALDSARDAEVVANTLKVSFPGLGTTAGTALEGDRASEINANNLKITYPVADSSKLAGIGDGANLVDLIEGAGVSIDKTDPQNPIITSTGAADSIALANFKSTASASAVTGENKRFEDPVRYGKFRFDSTLLVADMATEGPDGAMWIEDDNNGIWLREVDDDIVKARYFGISGLKNGLFQGELTNIAARDALSLGIADAGDWYVVLDSTTSGAVDVNGTGWEGTERSVVYEWDGAAWNQVVVAGADLDEWMNFSCNKGLIAFAENHIIAPNWDILTPTGTDFNLKGKGKRRAGIWTHNRIRWENDASVKSITFAYSLDEPSADICLINSSSTLGKTLELHRVWFRKVSKAVQCNPGGQGTFDQCTITQSELTETQNVGIQIDQESRRIIFNDNSVSNPEGDFGVLIQLGGDSPSQSKYISASGNRFVNCLSNDPNDSDLDGTSYCMLIYGAKYWIVNNWFDNINISGVYCRQGQGTIANNTGIIPNGPGATVPFIIVKGNGERRFFIENGTVELPQTGWYIRDTDTNATGLVVSVFEQNADWVGGNGLATIVVKELRFGDGKVTGTFTDFEESDNLTFFSVDRFNVETAEGGIGNVQIGSIIDFNDGQATHIEGNHLKGRQSVFLLYTPPVPLFLTNNFVECDNDATNLLKISLADTLKGRLSEVVISGGYYRNISNGSSGGVLEYQGVSDKVSLVSTSLEGVNNCIQQVEGGTEAGGINLALLSINNSDLISRRGQFFQENGSPAAPQYHAQRVSITDCNMQSGMGRPASYIVASEWVKYNGGEIRYNPQLSNQGTSVRGMIQLSAKMVEYRRVSTFVDDAVANDQEIVLFSAERVEIEGYSENVETSSNRSHYVFENSSADYFDDIDYVKLYNYHAKHIDTASYFNSILKFESSSGQSIGLIDIHNNCFETTKLTTPQINDLIEFSTAAAINHDIGILRIVDNDAPEFIPNIITNLGTGTLTIGKQIRHGNTGGITNELTAATPGTLTFVNPTPVQHGTLAAPLTGAITIPGTITSDMNGAVEILHHNDASAPTISTTKVSGTYVTGVDNIITIYVRIGETLAIINQ